MKILVVGRIGRPGQTELVEYLVKELEQAGFEVTSRLNNRIVDVEKDWRDDPEKAKERYLDLEEYFRNNQFDAIVADLSAASDGRTIEEMIARDFGIPIYGYAPVPVYSSWRLALADAIFRELDELVSALIKLEKELLLEKEVTQERRRRRDQNILYHFWGDYWQNALAIIVLSVIFFALSIYGIITVDKEWGLVALIPMTFLPLLIYSAYIHRRYVRYVNNT